MNLKASARIGGGPIKALSQNLHDGSEKNTKRLSQDTPRPVRLLVSSDVKFQ
jgi:hypothetical protein